MHARLTKFEGSPHEIETGIKQIKEQVIPTAKKLAGFKGGYWFVDRATGKGFEHHALRDRIRAARERRRRGEATRGGHTDLGHEDHGRRKLRGRRGGASRGDGAGALSRHPRARDS